MKIKDLQKFIKTELKYGIILANQEGDTWRVEYLVKIRIKLKEKIRQWYISKGMVPRD